MLAYIILFIAVSLSLSPSRPLLRLVLGPFGWFGARRRHRGPRPPRGPTMTSAPAVVSMAALAARGPRGPRPPGWRRLRWKRLLAVWVAAPVLAEPGARRQLWRWSLRRLRRHGRRQQPRRRSWPRTLNIFDFESSHQHGRCDLVSHLPRWCYFLPFPPPPFHPLKIMPFGNLCKITDIFQYFL